MLEKIIEKRLKGKVESLGGRAIKLDSVKGIPDRLILIPGGHVLFVEVKRPGEVVTRPSQRAWGEWLERNGFAYKQVNSLNFSFLDLL